MDDCFDTESLSLKTMFTSNRQYEALRHCFDMMTQRKVNAYVRKYQKDKILFNLKLFCIFSGIANFIFYFCTQDVVYREIMSFNVQK